MKQGTLFLKVAICFIGLLVLAFCIFAIPSITKGITVEWPLMAPLREPMMFGLYLTAIPFFIGLSQAFRLLSFIDKGNAFSGHSIKALKIIKYCALTMTGLYLILMPAVFLIAEYDDAPGLVIVGLVFACSPTVVAVFAAILQKLLQNAIDLQVENELTV